MDTLFAPRTRNTAQSPAPGAWWTVNEVAITGGFAIYYRLGRGDQRPAELRDERGRTVLEAFGSLPMAAMAERLDRYRQSLMGVEGAAWGQESALAAIHELHEFVRTFGPIGAGWGGEFGVRNPEAEQLKRDLDRERWRALGFDPDTVEHRVAPGYSVFWTASFWGHGPGRGVLPEVRRRVFYQGREWAERVRLSDDGLPQDYWLQLADEHQDLVSALALVEAIAQGDPFECRRAVRAFAPHDDAEFWVGGSSSTGLDLGRAYRGVRPAGGRVRLFRLPEHLVDWVLMGKFMLAGLIGRQVDFAMPLVDVSASERLEVRWRATSLLEVIYLELLDHLRRRNNFGVGKCGNCGGPILRTRRPGPTGNQWHARCHGGRVKRWREENPEWRSGRPPTYTPIATATSRHVRSTSPSSRRR